MKRFLPFTLLVIIGSTDKKDKNGSVDEYLSGQANYFRFNGNVLIAEKGEIVFQKSYAFKKVE